MTFTFIIAAAVIIILLIIPQVMKKIVYKKLTAYLSAKDYTAFEKLLDGFACTFSFKPYNREYMRLNSYFMQGDKKKIEVQLDTIFKKMKMKDEQRAAAARQGFYFYMENQKFKRAEEMLKICRKSDKNMNELHTMEMMYSILALKESKYIQEIKDRLDSLKKAPDAFTSDASRVRIGIFEYLLGLQYTYLNNKKLSKTYLHSALKNCRNTPYEYEIRKLL
ncbi:hypothetical protein MKC73_03235 [[Clostridium] innocuum]|nr:hypothetical protein [[Clostridium] innocuum]